ncbi:MAG: hypothetical protein J7539_02695 [Niabella sp.]|nr:hypothetical protein [Niabella sp.]
MKRSYLIAAAIGIFSLSASYAQDSTKAKKGMENRREAMYSDLNLTQDQKDKLKTLDEDGFKQMKALRDDQSLSDDQKKSKMMEMRKTQKEARDKILTKEQSEKLDAKMKEMRAKRSGAGS